ncbi:MAG: sensor histidine kinase [Bacteroidetes bacterium]|nr:sensor histidine kinase [Bacteroidota bacterium]MBP6315368.1 sensor histidine kinase [Chitinophagaceae bacterium]
MRAVACILLVCIASHCVAQPLADSLIKSCQTLHDTAKARIFIEKAASIQNKDYLNCIRLCDEAVAIGRNNQRLDFVANAHLLKGLTSYFAGEYDATLRYYLLAINQFDTLNDQAGKAKVYNELGFFYRKQKDDQAALHSFEEAHRLAKLAANDAVMATAINNQGVWAQDHASHPVALELFAKARALYVKLHDSIGVSYTLDYASVSLAAQKQFPQAMQFQMDAYDIRLRLKDTNAAALSLFCLAEFSQLQGKAIQSETYLKECLSITERIHYKELSAQCYLMLSAIFHQTGKHAEAYQYHVKYSTLNEEIFNEKRSQQISELQTQYETEKRIQQIVLLTKENELKENQQRNQRTIFFGVIIVLLIGTFAFYTFFKSKKQKEIDEAIIQEKEVRNKAIIEAEEKERMRIARDLHDGVAQTMTAAKMQLEHFIDQTGNTMHVSDSLKNAFELIVDAAKEVRSISHSMIPNALLKSGLVAAVRDFVNRMGNEKLKINLVVLGLNERLPEATETVIFRVLQELMNNIIKHANAKEITIQLIREADEFTMMVEDNGIGFDVQKMMDKQGMGLKNMSSRIEYLNGHIDFDSTLGRGSTVIVEIPL